MQESGNEANVGKCETYFRKFLQLALCVVQAFTLNMIMRRVGQQLVQGNDVSRDLCVYVFAHSNGQS